MNLVWHIVRKDYRRIGAALHLWLLLVLWHAVSPMVVGPSDEVVSSNYEGQRYLANMLGALVVALGFILAAWLVMEDSLVSTAAAWRTRPISGGRLLAAKALGALLMFSVLPVAVLTPVWLWCGFSLREWAYAALEWGLMQAVASLAAFALGGVTLTNRQFLVRLLVGFIALPLYLAYVLGGLPGQSGPGPGNVEETRSLLLGVVVALIPLAMVGHQFLTRRTGRTWLVFVAGLGLMWVAGRWWPWNLTRWHQPPATDTVAAAGPVFTVDRLVTKPLNSLDSRVPLELRGRVTGMAPGTHVRVSRVQSWWTGGEAPIAGGRLSGVETNGQPSEAIVRRVAGLAAPAEGEATWSATGIEQEKFLERVDAEHLKWRGMVRATVVQGAVLGELPLRVGATLRSGSSLTRINTLRWVENQVVVQLEERDAWLMTDSQVYSTSYNPAQRRIRPMVDSFVVLNRAESFHQMPGVQEVGTIKSDSLVVGRRNLVITLPEKADPGEWLKGAVILKVRFTPVQKIDRPVSGDPVTPTR